MEISKHLIGTFSLESTIVGVEADSEPLLAFSPLGVTKSLTRAFKDCLSLHLDIFSCYRATVTLLTETFRG